MSTLLLSLLLAASSVACILWWGLMPKGFVRRIDSSTNTLREGINLLLYLASTMLFGFLAHIGLVFTTILLSERYPEGKIELVLLLTFMLGIVAIPLFKPRCRNGSNAST